MKFDFNLIQCLPAHMTYRVWWCSPISWIVIVSYASISVQVCFTNQMQSNKMDKNRVIHSHSGVLAPQIPTSLSQFCYLFRFKISFIQEQYYFIHWGKPYLIRCTEKLSSCLLDTALIPLYGWKPFKCKSNITSWYIVHSRFEAR